MSITPLLALGLPLVRLALRLHAPSEANLAGAMSDFESLTTAVGDRADRREINRQLEHISDSILKRVSRFIEVEFPASNDGDVAAAAAAVTDAISDAGASDLASLVSEDVDAKRIESFIRAHGDFARQVKGPGEVSEGIARLILREMSHALVNIVRSNKEFTIEALVQLLARSSDLREYAAAIVKAVEDVPNQVLAAAATERRSTAEIETLTFDNEFRRAIINDYDKLELYGADLNRETRRYSLTTAYLSLRLSSTDKAAKDTSQDIAGVIPEFGMIVFRGEAGAGKTTIIQWLAVNAARRSFDQSLNRLNNSIPFVLKLRNYNDRSFPTTDAMVGATTSSLLIEEPEGWARSKFRTGPVLLLLDGLDELSEQKRPELLRWLERLLESGRRILIVVTARPSATEAIADLVALKAPHMDVADVLPLDRDQIRSFVLHWHNAIGANISSDSADFQRLGMQAGEKLATAREYRLLASSPLLCAVLCALFHLRKGALPGRRIEIYDTLLSLLTGERDSQRQVVVEPLPLSESEKKIILEDVADFFLVNGLSEAPSFRIIEVIARNPILSRYPQLDPMSVLHYFLRRSGILRAPVEGTVDFVHRTFLEYLAARAQVRHDRIELLSSKVREPTWAEAVVLAAGLGIERQVRSLVEAVLEITEATVDGVLNHEGASEADVSAAETLSATCAWFLETAVLLPDELRTRIMGVVKWTIPPSSLTAVRALASTGNTLLPTLAQSVTDVYLEQREVSMTIRTLGEIGTPEALAVLAKIPHSQLIESMNDLIAVWPWFSLEEYSTTILEPLRPHRMVEVVLPSSTYLPYVRNLSPQFAWNCEIDVPEESLAESCGGAAIGRLVVRNLDRLQDDKARFGSFIWEVERLSNVSLSGLCGLKLDSRDAKSVTIRELSLEMIEGNIGAEVWPALPNLRSLYIAGYADCDFAKLSDASRLKSLTLEGGLDVSLPAELELHSVTHLELHDIDDADVVINLISACVNLQTLNVSGVTNLWELSCTEGLNSLQVIELEAISDLEDISSVRTLAVLQSFSLIGSHRVGRSPIVAALAEEIPDLTIATPTGPWLDEQPDDAESQREDLYRSRPYEGGIY